MLLYILKSFAGYFTFILASLEAQIVKNQPAICETSVQSLWDRGSIPGSGRSAGEGNSNQLQYSCLETPHGQRSLVGYSPGGLKEWQGWATNTFTLPSFPLFYFILLLGIGKHPANQCANYNLTDLRPEHRDTLGGTWRTLAADSSSVCHSSQRQKWRK